ncbi:hypothetical protein GJ496_011835 [Pomphorhynchus laevis]|nr:hypothetical protein GJ496_011835 [Pomphorhynchus laevis]
MCTHSANIDCSGSFGLCTENDKERLGKEAITAIHEHLDDDKDGFLNNNESYDIWIHHPSTTSIDDWLKRLRTRLFGMLTTYKLKHNKSVFKIWIHHQSTTG